MDDVWVVVLEVHGLSSKIAALNALEVAMKEGEHREPLPANTARRPALHDLLGRVPGDLFGSLQRPFHHIAAWTINQLYLALPNPDANWAGDFQTQNFHTRMWEAHLLAAFREQGMLVTQPERSPDFLLQNRAGDAAWVEAVTANPQVRFKHFNAEPSAPPTDILERALGPAASRFAKTLRTKLQKNYHLTPHVLGNPFAIALADFHAPSSMIWSRNALISYLYALQPRMEGGRVRITLASEEMSLQGEEKILAGLFRSPVCCELSAVVFTNTCSISKFYRVPISGGAIDDAYRYIRFGSIWDRTPGATEGAPFCLDIESQEYRALWPQGYEPWSADLEVFHNPYAKHPFPRTLLPEANHWFQGGGNIECASHYKTAILSSQTLVLPRDKPIPSLEEIRATFTNSES
ncbi:hypothetical protein [Pseudomonas syringae]|uniref:hypothetical protein n=1 Tax=Pseudomonas syringae TaxID=317 RepID=UPI001F4767CF|nr:hypothetical protein [Pseudomonas syringae]